ncbi:hypothetical protein [Prevotella sp. kh1p2]|uniref:hypothetical protein n=1 Tax=Prevotella sp. kh1p2 TaxID=1761883 RepID=UPI0008AE6F2E|nr:hypothetical protein [Prevotella sp. kh1p2]SET20855.1 hypothetical protein SAMN04487825_12039 [Prevotella sp. kh1p2]SNU12244.1 hypothetical protein SAMN06298210_1215 [Prevotellaceae bacterium KH2P17]
MPHNLFVLGVERLGKDGSVHPQAPVGLQLIVGRSSDNCIRSETLTAFVNSLQRVQPKADICPYLFQHALVFRQPARTTCNKQP